ncbi:MAG TPA: YihY/virulence factor BrkB family protein [Acidobacteriota bacterium]|nr:YihY/virulence factor BrkB family protein [Acidobacteriota bacterium]
MNGLSQETARHPSPSAPEPDPRVREEPEEDSQDEEELSPPLGERAAEFLRLCRRIIVATYRHCSKTELSMMAASLSYISILSLLPLAAIGFVAFEYLGGLERLVDMIRPLMRQYLAPGMTDRVIGAIQEIKVRALGTGGIIGLILASMALFSSVESAINKVWKIKLRRSLVRRITFYGLFLLLGPLVLAVTGLAISRTLFLRSLVPLGWWGLVLSLGFFLLTIAIFYVMYKFIPDRPVDRNPALTAAIFSATSLQIARWGFSVYTSEIAAFTDYYNKIYGGLAAVALLIIWIFIAWLVVLVGTSLSVVMQHRLEAQRQTLAQHDFED